SFGAGISAGSRAFHKWWSGIGVAHLEPAAAPPSPVPLAQPSPVPLAQPSPPAPLSALAVGLHARRENRDVEITWNRESPVIAAATSGVLSIQDGSDQPSRDIFLDANQVRN